jgi:hypothetical protein
MTMQKSSWIPVPDSQQVVYPESKRFVRDTVRIKHKRVFTGMWEGHEVRFILSVVKHEGEEHLEVGGCIPAAQEALQDFPASLDRLQGALRAMVAFCDTLVLI